MISQRIAKLYYAYYLTKGNAIKDQLNKNIEEYEKALSELKTGYVNTSSIQSNLNHVEKQVYIIKVSIKHLLKGRSAPFAVENASEKMLWVMNEVTAEYAELSR